MKKIFFIICFLIISMCSGCNMAWDGSDTASADMKIGSDFTLVSGESNLYYANDTKIVYWIGGSYMLNGLGDDYTTSYITVWYSPNGKLYRYEPDKIYMRENLYYGEMLEFDTGRIVEID